MTGVEYRASDRFDVQTTDVVYLERPGGSLQAAIYQPQRQGPFPGLLDVHGGRWFLNDRFHDQHMNSVLAASGIVVVAIEFRLAP